MQTPYTAEDVIKWLTLYVPSLPVTLSTDGGKTLQYVQSVETRHVLGEDKIHIVLIAGQGSK